MSVICGINPVLEALRARTREFDRLVVAKGARNRRVSEAIHEATRMGIPVRFEAREALDRMVGGINHQGVVAVVSAKMAIDLEALIGEARDPTLILALDGVEDPRNLGAILRSAEAAGADGVILPERHCVGLTETVSRASAGALEHVRVARVGNMARALETLKRRGLWIVGLDAAAEQRWHTVDMTRGVVLVVGGEGRGIRRLVRESCDYIVSVPMFGHVGSLNVSVVAGVALYEAVRQRGRIPSHVRPIPPRLDECATEATVIGPGPDDDEEDPGRIHPPASRDGVGEIERDLEAPAIRILGLEDDSEWSVSGNQPRVIRKSDGRRRRWLERRRQRRMPSLEQTGARAPANERHATESQPCSEKTRSRRRRRRKLRPGVAPVSTPEAGASATPAGAPSGVDGGTALTTERRRPRRRRRRRR